MRRLEEELIREPGHDKVFDAMGDVANRLTYELNKAGSESKIVEDLIETTREYDRFLLKFYLNKMLDYL